jgi:uncharacterized membrane protein YedE/YeeE
MVWLPGWAIALCGGLIGFVIGFAARRGRLCTFGALEDAFIGGNFRRLKVLALALGLAVLITQILILSGALWPEVIRYTPSRLPFLGILLGSVMFGFGMALCGTCAFGTLVRLGGGDLRSLVVFLVFAVAALATLRGFLSDVRITHLEAVSLAMPGGVQSDVAALASWVFGTGLRPVLALAIPMALAFWAMRKRELFETPRLLSSGLLLGGGVAAGWIVTGAMADPMALVVQPVSLTFVAPVADAIHLVVLSGSAGFDFGVASVIGVAAGSFAASKVHDEFRWETYDDHREMKRHLSGAILMGAGGVLAGGCTIGQGLTAGSVLAVSWLPAVAGMAAGARWGLHYLMEGRLLPWGWDSRSPFAARSKTKP